jgi:hypothetical protein
MIEHVYFLLDEAKDRIRIGSTHNLLDRLFKHLKAPVGSLWKVLGVTEGGIDREKEIHALFAKLRLKRESTRKKKVSGASDEWFRDTPELRTWITENTKPWDGSDTFNWQSNIPSPTLALRGAAEWISWLEEFACHLGVGPGTLVESALAEFARSRDFRPSPPRTFDQGNRLSHAAASSQVAPAPPAGESQPERDATASDGQILEGDQRIVAKPV